MTADEALKEYRSKSILTDAMSEVRKGMVRKVLSTVGIDSITKVDHPDYTYEKLVDAVVLFVHGVMLGTNPLDIFEEDLNRPETPVPYVATVTTKSNLPQRAQVVKEGKVSQFGYPGVTDPKQRRNR
jgi:hypothetical protein